MWRGIFLPRMRSKNCFNNGFVLLDKPSGFTSASALAAVQRALGKPKAGHLGTLDPLATGLLPLAMGRGCKLVPYLNTLDKEYEFTIFFGVGTASDDGETLAQTSRHRVLSLADIEAAVAQFNGVTYLQKPPVFSALKMGGVAAHVLARDGKTPDLAPRPQTIHNLSLKEKHTSTCYSFTVHCNTGTYVRSLARDIAAALDTVGYVSQLRRTAVGGWRVEKAVAFQEVAAYKIHVAPIWMLPLSRVLDDIPALRGNTAVQRIIDGGLDVAHSCS
ncbi:MAG: tRNA pseudouridine(55) synthase TruB [Holosporales bacterium]